MTATSAPIQTCRTCYRRLPIGHFRRRHRDSEDRHRQCNTCRNAAERDRRRQIRLHDADRFANGVNQARSRVGIESLCTTMIHRFGGIEQFAATWWEAIQDAARRSPGSRVVLNHFKAIAHLHCYAEKQREKSGEPLVDDVDQMTTKEINAELDGLIQQEALRQLETILQDMLYDHAEAAGA